jgi:hypothetical protein
MKVTAAVPDIFEVARTWQQPVHPRKTLRRRFSGGSVAALVFKAHHAHFTSATYSLSNIFTNTLIYGFPVVIRSWHALALTGSQAMLPRVYKSSHP